jgi:hypothetical protein
MHVVLLTLMTLSGADPIAVQQSSATVTYPAAAQAPGCQGCGSSACNGSSCGYGSSHYDRKINRQLQRYMSGSRHGPMPQTCYSPRYGCYHGNDRHMHRYPAFHGTYYRRPYNYRNLFEYPWHAEMHEPTSYFSYNVPPEAMNMPTQAQPIDAPPELPPSAARQREALPFAPPQPMTQPVFAPRDNRSAGMGPAPGVDTVQFLPPPRLNDQDLAGVNPELVFEQERVAPAPIESTADATPYQEGSRRDAPRSISATPIMLRPMANPQSEELQAVEKVQPISRNAENAEPRAAQSIEAKPISARRESSLKEASASRQSKAISLGQPQSVELKPLAVQNNVAQAKAVEQSPASSMVQPTSASQPVEAESNPLRTSLRR